MKRVLRHPSLVKWHQTCSRFAVWVRFEKWSLRAAHSIGQWRATQWLATRSTVTYDPSQLPLACIEGSLLYTVAFPVLLSLNVFTIVFFFRAFKRPHTHSGHGLNGKRKDKSNGT